MQKRKKKLSNNKWDSIKATGVTQIILRFPDGCLPFLSQDEPNNDESQDPDKK